MTENMAGLVAAATRIDWMQVLLNLMTGQQTGRDGQPCFFVGGGHFCLRAKFWAGHDDMHKFVSLETALEAAAPAGTPMSADYLARLFHATYERLAPQYGYVTRKESAVEWEQVPENNRKLMTAVCEAILLTEKFNSEAAALATPSPQAPDQFKEIPPRSEDLQIFVDHARGQVRSKGIADWVDLKNLLRVIDSMKYEAAIAQRPDIATPGEIWRENAAATQEPAGSGAQWSCLNFDHACNLRGYCVNKNCTEFGSPRKVGEDGQPSKLRPTYYVRHPDDTFSIADPQPVKEFKAILQQRINDILAARNEYEEDDTATSHCFHLMEVERILDGKSVSFGALARPSSVPVGEQKQEEGV